jgi:2'-5' RNA ligase
VGKFLRRLFLAVPLDDEVRLMLAQHLDPDRLPGKPVQPQSWHLTVRFLGRADELTQDKVTAGLDQSDLGDSFDIQLGEMGAFPRPARATVLWLALARGVERLSELRTIGEELSVAAGLEPEGRPYSPHLTLSRIRPDQDVRPVMAAYEPRPFRWTATELVLFESRLGRGGAVYEPVESFPFTDNR